MARSYAQLHTSIWQDRDFCSLPALAQRVYLMLISQPTVSYAGVLAYTERRFAAMAGDTTKGGVADAMCVLEDRGYVVTDEDTEEVWVRSWSRYNGVLDHPNLRKAMKSAYEDVLSPGVKAAIYAEYGSDENLLLTTPEEPDAMPSRRQPEPDATATVQVTSREDLDLDLHQHTHSERSPASTGSSEHHAPSTALSLLTAAKRKSHGHEIDEAVTALAVTHGPDAVERAIQQVADRLGSMTLGWPSDVRKALEAELGPAPVDAKPSPLDDAQKAQYTEALGGLAKVRETTSYQPSEDEKRRVLEQLRARKPA